MAKSNKPTPKTEKATQESLTESKSIVEEVVNEATVEVDTTVKVDAPVETNNDLISKQKVVDIINSTMLKYKGKVVLAMTEVKDIINTILAAIKE